ncbi:MAG: MmcQ/YjbR family DNA-binding protein [Blastocatellia bacterium]|nr:MmcQ/YjbR family DNA-binding protein [Blastocatellia bacterium]
MSKAKGKNHLERVRRICLALPGSWEKLSHGEPTFFAGKKVFAMYSNNHHNDGHIAVLCPAPLGIQTMLIEAEPSKFYKPAYVGVRGWIGIDLDSVRDDELTAHIRQAWRMIATKKLQADMEKQEENIDAKTGRKGKRVSRTS